MKSHFLKNLTSLDRTYWKKKGYTPNVHSCFSGTMTSFSSICVPVFYTVLLFV